MTKFTILGATGFIGNQLKNYIESKNTTVFCPDRNYIFDKNTNYGHIIYCIGLTADFRTKPFETIDAHVSTLSRILQEVQYNSFLYLSSTRVYGGAQNSDVNSQLVVNPNHHDDLYNISKLLGESLCINMKNENVKIARISNVLGNDFNSKNFITEIISSAIKTGKIELQSPIDYSKDYITIQDVVQALYKISTAGKEKIYNVASGYNISNREIIMEIEKHVNFKLIEKNLFEPLSFPIISITELKQEFNYKPIEIKLFLTQLVLNFKKHLHDSN